MSDLNAQTILDAGKATAAHVEIIEGIPTLVAATSFAPLASVLELADKRADKPRRRAGIATLQSIAGFCGHVNRFKGDQSAVFADAASRKFIGVLNYHPAGSDSPPAWGDHRALYLCPLSGEWKTWGQGAPIEMDQDTFAEFLDAHDRDLAANVADIDGKPYPSPAALMSLAANLEAYSSRSSKRERTQTGSSLIFTADNGVKSNVDIPRAFAVKIPIFVDSAPAAIEVRLRVKSEDGAPSFTIQIHDADKVLRTAFEELVKVVAETTALPAFVGTPEQ